MKRLTVFLQRVLEDLGRMCCTSTTKDLETVLRRIEHERMSFLTITLSGFGKDFERCLDAGQVDPLAFAGFSRRAGLPRFLGGFLGQVFDPNGRLLDEPSVDAIYALRQFTLMWAKISIPCTQERTDAAIRRYVECDAETRETQKRLWNGEPHEVVSAYRRLSSLLWADTLVDLERKLLAVPSQIIPKHGPGATAERTHGNQKWVLREWTDRLDEVFPAGEHLVSSWKFLQELADVQYREPGTERPVRVITVPKSASTPRIIAIEPTCMQFMQQGLLAGLEQSLRRDELLWSFIGWRSQVPNNHLAAQGSRDESLGILDLSEASDRVAEQHVRGLLGTTPALRAAVDSCRSRTAAVPGYGDVPERVISLAKFASMGSALCFPFESMVFFTIVCCGIEKAEGRPLTRRFLKTLRGCVRVYGDDIIVPVRYVRAVITELEAHGLKVNVHKSFWTGKFRESCGKEYYDGQDVSITRLRAEFPSSLRDGKEIISTISTRNQLYNAGLWGAAGYLDTLVSRVIGCPLPRVSEGSPVLGRQSIFGPDLSGELDKETHRPLVRGPRIRVTIPDSPLDGYGALLKCLTQLEARNPSPRRAPVEQESEMGDVKLQWADFLPTSMDEQNTSMAAVALPGYSRAVRLNAHGVRQDDIWELQAPDVGHLDRSGRPRSVNIKIGKGPSA